MKKQRNAVTILLVIGMLLTTGGLWRGGARAARLELISDTLSSSAPTADSSHTLKYRSVTKVPGDGYVTITLPAGFTIDAGLDKDEIKFEVGSDGSTYYDRDGLDNDGGAGCGSTTDCVDISGQVITITLTSQDNVTCDSAASGHGSIPAACYVRITLDTQGTPDLIANPSKVAAAGTADIYDVGFATNSMEGSLDSGDAKIAIQDQVGIQADVSSSLTFSVSGQEGGDFTPTATSVDFGELVPATAKTGIQRLVVTTDAKSGYTVTLKRGATKLNEGTYDIDDFTGTNGSPAAWSSPNGTSPGVNTGWIGYHTSDSTLGTGTAARFSGADTWAAMETTTYEVLYSDVPANGESSGDGVGYADITYKIEVNVLQPTAQYTGLTITYICTSVY